jgi:sugar-specific transcriptional regulator TrmB
MIAENEDIKTLMDLGLTYQQAKTYLAITELGEAAIKNIAKTSNIARQNIYQTMLSLQELGLVEKILGAPVKFRAIPLKSAVEMLFKNKTREYHKLESETEQLMKKPEGSHVSPDERHEFILIAEREAHSRRVDQILASAKVSIHTIMTYLGAPGLHDLPAALQEAIARGVKVKVLSNQPKDRKTTNSQKSPWTRNGVYEVRYSNTSIPVMFCLVDGKEVLIATEPKPNPMESSALWTNNPCLTTILEDFFSRTWRKAKLPG